MDENVTSVAMVDQRLRWRGVTGKDDGAIRRFKAKAERIQIIAVMHRKGRHRHIAVSMDDPWRNLVHIHLARRPGMPTDGANAEVHLPCLQDVLSHGP